MTTPKIVYTDGSDYKWGSAFCIYLAQGWSVKKNERKMLKVLEEKKNVIEIEYEALYAALEKAVLTRRPVIIYSDNVQLVDEMNLTKVPSRPELLDKARNIIGDRQNIKVYWVPREQNIAGRFLERRLKRLNASLKRVLNPTVKRFEQKKRREYKARMFAKGRRKR
jgi:ribonuclease HI